MKVYQDSKDHRDDKKNIKEKGWLRMEKIHTDYKTNLKLTDKSLKYANRDSSWLLASSF